MDYSTYGQNIIFPDSGHEQLLLTGLPIHEAHGGQARCASQRYTATTTTKKAILARGQARCASQRGIATSTKTLLCLVLPYSRKFSPVKVFVVYNMTLDSDVAS